MAQVTISFEADLRRAVESFVQLARQVRTVDGGLAELVKTAAKAAREIERAGDAQGKAKKETEGHSEAVSSLIGKFTAVAGAGALLAKSLDFVNSAHQAAMDRARQHADELQRIVDLNKAIAGASGYKVGQTVANRELAAQLGVEAKVGRDVALAAVSKGTAEGFNRADILAAMQLNRVSGTDPTKLFEVADKGQVQPGGISGLANILLALQAQTGQTGNEQLDALDKLIGGAGQLGYSPAQVAGLSAAIGERLRGKQSAGAIDSVLQALVSLEIPARPAEDIPVSAAELAEAQRTGVAPVRRKTPAAPAERIKLWGTAKERLYALSVLAPDKYRELTEDAQMGIVVNQINAGGLDVPLEPGDLLGPAARNRDASIEDAAIDMAAQADAATLLGEGRNGAAMLRAEAKKRMLVEGLRQAGKGQLYTQWATETLPNWTGRFGGGAPEYEAAIEKAAEAAGVSLDPNRVVRGRAGDSVLEAEKRAADFPAAFQQGWELAGRNYTGGYFGKLNPPRPGWSRDAGVNAQRLLQMWAGEHVVPENALGPVTPEMEFQWNEWATNEGRRLAGGWRSGDSSANYLWGRRTEPEPGWSANAAENRDRLLREWQEERAAEQQRQRDSEERRHQEAQEKMDEQTAAIEKQSSTQWMRNWGELRLMYQRNPLAGDRSGKAYFNT